ncbi:MAG: crossover junction endodeoxyribonuclease RuvC [Leptospiraceae bacterium]|nr:MAG: crossover junction endodeoxyribonuclease RuvC [Leptospiraceae bacterium]
MKKKSSEHTIESYNLLGIDPGLERTGWCIVNPLNDLIIIPGIIITSSTNKIQTRLYLLQNQIETIIQEHHIKILAIEKIIASKKIESKLIEILQARGVLLALAGKYDLAVVEIAPSTIKKAITGSGKARKNDIKNTLQHMYKIEHKKEFTDDVYDAIAIALTGKEMILK